MSSKPVKTSAKKPAKPAKAAKPAKPKHAKPVLKKVQKPKAVEKKIHKPEPKKEHKHAHAPAHKPEIKEHKPKASAQKPAHHEAHKLESASHKPKAVKAAAAPAAHVHKAEEEPKGKKPKIVLPECKIILGFAGMPVSAKARTIQETVVYAHNMGLEALEIQLTHGTEIEDDEAQSIKVLAEQAGVHVTVHAPYYTSLAADEQTVKSSIETIQNSMIYAHKIGAEILVFHLGFFMKSSRAEAMKMALKNVHKIAKFRDSKKIKILLGVENSGDDEILGDLDEVIQICQEIEGAVPVTDLAHYHARTNGALKEIADFEALIEKLKPLKLKNYYMHMSGVIHKNGKEINHVPIKKSDLNYAAFAEFLLKKGIDVTLISDSPILEYDAVTMRTQMNFIREKLTGIAVEEVKPAAFGSKK
ncbi:MAG: TIM barrel protein [Candidatus Thermoplasmatota archaeon]|nr:TIM barrel protein [Candidatus Thermoplasmatota archaeon]